MSKRKWTNMKAIETETITIRAGGKTRREIAEHFRLEIEGSSHKTLKSAMISGLFQYPVKFQTSCLFVYRRVRERLQKVQSILSKTSWPIAALHKNVRYDTSTPKMLKKTRKWSRRWTSRKFGDNTTMKSSKRILAALTLFSLTACTSGHPTAAEG